jgi:tetratricopeptide (TPR) repeat protein
MRTRITTSLLALLTLSFALGCSDDDESNNGVSRLSLSSAWNAFEGGDLAGANSAFQDALAGDPAYAEAWCGLGWTRALQLAADPGLGSSEGVIDAFRQADRFEENYVDAWAGLAEAYNWEADTLAALEWALDAAETGGNAYAFEHVSNVTHRSLRKIAAWNYFKLSRYDEAGEQVQTVLTDFVWRGRPDSLEYLFESIGGL